MVTLLDLLNRGVELLAERLVLVVLDAHRARLDVLVVSPLHFKGIINHDHLLQRWVPLGTLALEHGLVVRLDCVFVTECRVDLLFDDVSHDRLKLAAHGIQKGSLIVDFLLGERAHRDQLLQEPLVALSKLPQFNVHVALVNDVDEELAQAFV